MNNALQMIVEKNIMKYQEKITKEAFALYQKGFRGKGTPSLSQMNALVALVKDADNYDSLLRKLEQFLTKQEKRNEEKKISWAKDVGGESLAKTVKNKLREDLKKHEHLKHYITAIKAETSFLKSNKNQEQAGQVESQILALAMLQYLKSYFSAVLRFYRIEREKELTFSLSGGELRCQ